MLRILFLKNKPFAFLDNYIKTKVLVFLEHEFHEFHEKKSVYAMRIYPIFLC